MRKKETPQNSDVRRNFHDRSPRKTGGCRRHRKNLLPEEGVVFGLANLGSSRDKERPDWGELRAIYLLPEYWRKGSGTALFQAAEAELRRRGYARYFLWVFCENARARRFYEKMGMRPAGRDQPFTLGGKELWECRYEKELL